MRYRIACCAKPVGSPGGFSNGFWGSAVDFGFHAGRFQRVCPLYSRTNRGLTFRTLPPSRIFGFPMGFWVFVRSPFLALRLRPLEAPEPGWRTPPLCSPPPPPLRDATRFQGLGFSWVSSPNLCACSTYAPFPSWEYGFCVNFGIQSRYPRGFEGFLISKAHRSHIVD